MGSLPHLQRNTPAGELLVERLEHLSLPFLARIWRRRAELLGGCPVLDMKGERIIMSRLREDPRSQCAEVRQKFITFSLAKKAAPSLTL